MSLQEDQQLSAETKLYYELYLPEQVPAPLLLALHGYGANKRQMMREAKQMAPPTFVIASLQGFHQHIKEPREPGGPLRFGFGWLTSYRPEESVRMHHQAILDLLTRLIDKNTVNAQRVYLLGFSQSCALNYRFAFTHPKHLHGVIGICGGLPGDWEASDKYQTTSARVFHLAGTNDQFYPPARVEDYAERLRLRAHNVQFQSYSAGHEITPAMRADVFKWLQL
ncbi:MAG TPA: dienelactone hydrolase family protein [Pyrinomonadaceae bacterium]